MADTHNNVRIPPDSTGKRLRHLAKWIVNYDNGVSDFEQGDQVSLVTSGLTGTVDDVVGTTTSGFVGIILSEFSVGTPIDGENIQVDGVTYATVNGTPTEEYYYPVNVIASGTTPGNHAEVDQYGSLSVRPREGDFQLGPTGRLKVGGELTIGVYEFQQYTLPNIISTTTVGGGTQANDSTYGANKYSVGTASGDKVQRRTDVYHLVQPNFPVIASTLMQLGDDGKDNLRRRWGLFDDNNGFFFELDSTGLYVVTRTNSSGSPVDTRVAQSDWNTDRVDGSGGVFNRSQTNLDVTKINYYWIGCSPSAGTVIFGVRTNQRTIYCHEVAWTNRRTRPVVKAFSLPLTWLMENTGVTASSSEMYVVYGQVVADSNRFDVAKNPASFPVEGVVVTNDWTPVASVRPKQTGPVGEDNRVWLIPHKLNVLSTDQPILYRVRIGNTLAGATWGGATSLSEYDIDATSSAGGITVYSGTAGAGSAKVDEIVSSGDVTPLTTKITRRADITATPLHFTLEAKTITGSTSAVYVSVVQFEVV